MTQPTVACIMLANGRPAMVARAVESFRVQTYENKRLLIYDNQASMTMPNLLAWSCTHPEDNIWVEHSPNAESIGALRNAANAHKYSEVDIICHFDSDDWSHTNRIAEQVALLQSSGAECVGYNEMLFWDSTKCMIEVDPSKPAPGGGPGCLGIVKSVGEAWVYTMAFEPQRYAMGASMCYWRETWERHPFPDQSAGCDDLFWFNAKLNIRSVSAFQNEYGILKEPAMICGMHGSNTCASAAPGAKEWTRMPACDGYAREAMKL